jgi:hypothetical protein
MNDTFLQICESTGQRTIFYSDELAEALAESTGRENDEAFKDAVFDVVERLNNVVIVA